MEARVSGEEGYMEGRKDMIILGEATGILRDRGASRTVFNKTLKSVTCTRRKRENETGNVTIQRGETMGKGNRSLFP